jgi:ribosomal protein S18 acetylase RimI-like enzyme
MSAVDVALVRPNPDQLPLIHSYLEQLAQHEGVARANASDEFLRRTLFGESPVAVAHLVCARWPRDGQAARSPRTPCGLVIYSWKWGAFSGVMDMYAHVLLVDPAFRGAGIGRAAMSRLLDIANAHGASRVELLTTADNSSAAAFYDKLGLAQASHMVVRRKACAISGSRT